jgi:hypothetical protein
VKITIWNANGKFREKFQQIVKMDADIYVIQECENPDHATGEYKKWATNSIWIGKRKHRGLGVFAKATSSLQKLDWEDNDFQSFLPARINAQLRSKIHTLTRTTSKWARADAEKSLRSQSDFECLV